MVIITLARSIGGGGKMESVSSCKNLGGKKSMRLRKNMKRTAAAALALSMAVSTAAMPASAGYNIDMSKVDGDVEITQDDDGDNAKVTIKVGGVDKTDELKDGKDDNNVTITGDNRGQAVENGSITSENKAEDAEPVEQEQTAEDDIEAEPSDEEENADDEPQDSSDAEEEETTEGAPTEEKTESGDAAADKQETSEETEETQPEVKAPAADEEKDEEKDDEDTATYEAENKGPVEKVVNAFTETVRNVIKIINNSKKEMNVTLKDATIDAGDRAENAMTISGSGDVTLNVKGKNTLVGGSGNTDTSATESTYFVGDGLDSSDLTKDEGPDPTLKITSADKDSVLTAVGGNAKADAATVGGGNGIYAANLVIDGAKVTAKGGDAESNRADAEVTCGRGIYASGDGNIEMVDADITAIGGSSATENQSQYVWGGSGIESNSAGKWKNSHVTAIGGEVVGENEGGSIGGNGVWIYESSGLTLDHMEIQATGGNASTKGNGSGGTGFVFDSYDEGTISIIASNITLRGGKTEKKSGDGEVVSGGSGAYVAAGIESVAVSGGSANIVAGDAVGGAQSNAPIIGDANVTWKFTDNAKATLEYKENFGGVDEETDQTLTTDESSTVKIILPKGADLGDDGPDYGIDIDGGDEEDENSGNKGLIYIYEKNENGGADLIGAVEGDKMGKVDASLKAPTCTESGYVKDEDGEAFEVPAAGHNYVNGVCSICGAHEGETPVQPEENGSSVSASASFTVVGADAYEASLEDGRYIIAVPADAAVLEATLGDLRVLKEQGAEVLVFRTQSRESVLNIDEMLSLGTDATPFTLTHSGTTATLTVGGVEHNECIH